MTLTLTEPDVIQLSTLPDCGIALDVEDKDLLHLNLQEVVVEPYEKTVYGGPYEIDPLFTDQTLATADKIMEDDVTVNAIMVSYVSNPQGGETAYIGGEFING